MSGDSSTTKVVAVTGASSFIGQHLVRRLLSLTEIEMRFLIHNRQPDTPAGSDRIVLIPGDLLRPDTLERFLVPDCMVINLAYLSDVSERHNLDAAAHLADACSRAPVKRLVHCSTAMVVGNVSDNVISEETWCKPGNNYEITKLKIEEVITEKARDHFDLVILRPTAVFGPGGKNLLQLADDLSTSSVCLNYIKSCLFNDRRMNLVSVDHVVSALIFLAFAERRWESGVFIASDDEHPLNNYLAVEKYLSNALGFHGYPFPRIPLPSHILSAMLKLAGRSNSNPFRKYYAGKLRAAGFKNTTAFESGLDLFANWYKSRV